MKMKDLIQLQRWLSSGATLADVQLAPQYGLVDNERFTENARRWFIFLWTWSAPRFASAAGYKQDIVYQRHGRDALNRRFDRANRIINKITGMRTEERLRASGVIWEP